MEKEKLIQSILRNTEKELRLFFREESDIECPVEYEKRLIEMSRNHGLNILSFSRGKVPRSRNSKKRYRRP